MIYATERLDARIGDTIVCNNLSIAFHPGQFWAVMGINGVGKTTLLHTLCGLREPDNGSINLAGKSISSYTHVERARLLGLMPQSREYTFPCTVLEAALIGRHPHLAAWQWESTTDYDCAIQALRVTGLDHLQHRSVQHLSGGEKKRLEAALMLTQDPAFYLLDEPVSHLDLKAQTHLLTLLRDHFKQNDKTGIMVIHDPSLALRFCDHCLLLLGNGEWIAGPTTDILTSESLSQAFACNVKRIEHESCPFFYIE